MSVLCEKSPDRIVGVAFDPEAHSVELYVSVDAAGPYRIKLQVFQQVGSSSR